MDWKKVEECKTLEEIAEVYGKEKLDEILSYLEKKGLKGTSPYRQFKILLFYAPKTPRR